MYSRIVVGTDGTDRSLIAVDHAARLAAACSAELHVVAVASIVRESAVRIGHDVCKRHGIRAVEHFEESEWAAAMIAIAADVDADLVVVGSTVESSGQEVLALELRRSLLIVHTG